MAAITHGFQLAGQTPPTKHPLVTRTVAGARRTLGSAARQATPLRLAELRYITAAMAIVANRKPTDPMIRRDRARVCCSTRVRADQSPTTRATGWHTRRRGPPPPRWLSRPRSRTRPGRRRRDPTGGVRRRESACRQHSAPAVNTPPDPRSAQRFGGSGAFVDVHVIHRGWVWCSSNPPVAVHVIHRGLFR